MTTFQELYCEHLGLSFEKQLHLSDVVGERPWGASIPEARLSFGGDLRFKVQLLGTESEAEGTWLWAWANDLSNIPPAALASARRLRELGQAHGVPELTTPELGLDQVDGHTLAMVAAGLVDAQAYYRGPYRGGALFMAIHDPAFPPRTTGPERMVTVLSQLIELCNEGYRAAFTAYVRHHGFTVEDAPEVVTARRPDGCRFVARFDELGRVARLESTLK